MWSYSFVDLVLFVRILSLYPFFPLTTPIYCKFRYYWGPHYSLAAYCLINVVTVDGRTCLSLLSSVLPQGELERAASLMKQSMIEQALGSGAVETTEKDKHI